MKENGCCEKKTYRDSEEKRRITNRLSRMEGQVKGIKKW